MHENGYGVPVFRRIGQAVRILVLTSAIPHKQSRILVLAEKHELSSSGQGA